MIKKLCSFTGFCIILFSIFLLQGGIVLLIGVIEGHSKRILAELAEMREMMGAIPVEHTEI